MHFKLLIALVGENKTETVLNAARNAGATGATVINHTRGEGLKVTKTFFGLSLETNRDMIMFIVEEHLSRKILETIGDVGGFSKPGTGVVFQIDIEDVVVISKQIESLTDVVEEQI